MTNTIAIVLICITLMIHSFNDNSLSERVKVLEVKVQELSK